MHLPVGTRSTRRPRPRSPPERGANWKRENRSCEWLQPLHRPGSGRLPVKSWTQFHARRLRQSGRNDPSLSRLCHGQTASCQPASSNVIGTRGSPMSGTLTDASTASSWTPAIKSGLSDIGMGDRSSHPATERGERSLCQVGAAPRVPPAVRILGPKPSPIEPAALDD
jgi:hypothetical protein